MRVIIVTVALALPTTYAGAQANAPAEPRSAIAAAFDSLRTENSVLAARVDSITQSLRDHRVTETFFGAQLERQTGVYGIVVGAALALFGLLTYGGFRIEVRRHKRDMLRALDEQKTVAARAEERLVRTERLARQTAGNTYVAISSVYEREKPGSAIAALLLAGANFYAACDAPNDRNEEIGAYNLREALQKLENVRPNERSKVARELADERGKFEDAFELLKTYGTRNVTDVVSEIRVCRNKMIQETGAGSREEGQHLPNRPTG